MIAFTLLVVAFVFFTFLLLIFPVIMIKGIVEEYREEERERAEMKAYEGRYLQSI